MRKYNKKSFIIPKGFLIGVGALIPGLSGGTMAIVTGLFEQLLEASAGIFKHFKKSFKLFIQVSIGCLGAVIFISPLIEEFSTCFPELSKIVFCFISATGTFVFAKNNIKAKNICKKIIYIFIGAAFCILTHILLSGKGFMNLQNKPIGLIILGMPLSIALILPGISFSYMLLYFGLYNTFISAINSLDIKFLLPILIGTLMGTLLFSKILLKLMESHKQETYLIILGFSIISVINIILK